MATELAGQGKDMDEDEKGVRIKFHLSDVILKWNDKVAACKLRMPSVLRPASEDPTVVFELVLDDDDWHSFQLMKEIIHPNILHLRAVQENKLEKEGITDYWGLVEPHTGILYDYLKTGLGMPSSMKTVPEIVLPTDMLRIIVKQILDGLEYLMYRGRYHGNFSLQSTYYHRRLNGTICAKLTGFKKKAQKNSLCQTQDVLALGKALDVVSSIAVDYNKVADTKKKGPRFDTYVIDDLSKKLKLVTEANLRTIYQDTRKHPFFWELEQRTKFFIYKVASAMNNKDDFKSRVASSNDLFTQLKWNLDDYDGFLKKMNNFRTGRGTVTYDGSSKCDFVLFVCGIYTHESLLKNKPHTADNTLMKRHPHLCVVLSDLLGSDNGDWL